MAEIKRFPDKYKKKSLETIKCVRCDKELELWFNGGELEEVMND